MKAAVIGTPAFISGFEMVGFEGFKAVSESEVRKVIQELIETNNYGLIIIPERYTSSTRDIRDRLAKEGRVAPIFSFIPDYSGVKGERVEELKQLLSLALGVQLEL